MKNCINLQIKLNNIFKEFLKQIKVILLLIKVYNLSTIKKRLYLCSNVQKSKIIMC